MSPTAINTSPCEVRVGCTRIAWHVLLTPMPSNTSVECKVYFRVGGQALKHWGGPTAFVLQGLDFLPSVSLGFLCTMAKIINILLFNK